MKLFSKVLGEGHDLIILHGLYGAGDNWLSIARNLAMKFRVHLVDQRNHGNSPHDALHSYAALVDDLKEYIEASNISCPIILGHSMGGKTAMWFSIRYPYSVSELIVVDISPVDYAQLATPSGIIRQHLNIIQGLRSIDISVLKTRNEIDKELAEYISGAQIRQFLLKSVGRDASGKFYWKINVEAIGQFLPEIMKGIDIEKYAARINTKMPVLFIRGELSDYIPEKDLEQIKILYPQAEIGTIFGAGHWIHAEKPEAFLSVVDHFLQKSERSST